MGYYEKWSEFVEKYQKLCMENDTISDELFKEFGVNRGLSMETECSQGLQIYPRSILFR